MRLVDWLIVLSAGLGAITSIFVAPGLPRFMPVEPVWLRPVAVIGLLLGGLLIVVGGGALWRSRS